jgi:Skp family chaperone for outer membrane proteins
VRASRRACALVLGVFLCAAASRTAPVGFIDLPRLVSVHPLHKILAQYDREIAALQNTRDVPGLSALGAQTERGAAAVQRDVAGTTAKVQRIAAGAARDHVQERQAMGALFASQHAPNGEMSAYRDELTRETNANLRGYAIAIAQRTARAVAARQQQLHERELTLAFDLARRDSGVRLVLRLKLQDLHLDAATRARLQDRLAALNRRDSDAVAAARANDAAILARYRATLERDGELANAQMASELLSKAGANLALRLGVLRAGSSAADVVPNLASRLESFASSDHPGADATAVEASLRSAKSDLPLRFATLADADRRSRVETSSQIQNLKNNRGELYRMMVAQILRDARQLARQRHLSDLVATSPRPSGSVDLTGAVAHAEVSRF